MRRRTLLGSTLLGAAALGVGATACSSGTADGPPSLRVGWWGNNVRAEATRKALDAFAAAHPGVTVTGESAEFQGYFDKLATQTAGGDAPDVFALGGAYPAEYAGRGALLDLGTVSGELDLPALLDAGAVTNGQVKGVQYGATTGTNALSVIINEQVFDAARIDVPDTDTWTWDEFADVARRVTEATPDGTFGTASALTHDSLDLYARQRGERLYTEDGKLGLTAATIEAFLAFSKQLTDSKAAPPATVIEEQRSASTEQTLLATNRAAMMLTWSNFATPFSTASGQAVRLGRVPGESPTRGIWLQSSQFWAISATTRFPTQAAQLVAFLVGDPAVAPIIRNDRGVPAAKAVRDALVDELDGPGRTEVDYVAGIGAMDLQPTYIGPPGSTAVADITNRALSDTLFGRRTPAEAAAGWVSETEQAIAG